MICYCISATSTSTYNISYTTTFDNPLNQTGGIYAYKLQCKPQDCYTPKFKAGQRIVYYTYLLSTYKIAIHDIIEVVGNDYICKNSYDPEKSNVFDAYKTDKHFMELGECMDKYPEYFIKGKFNNPNTRI